MKFQRVTDPSLVGMGMEGYLARAGVWNFLIIKDLGKWSTSYRLHNPKRSVSASSTIMGPFEDFADAVRAAEDKLAELKRLA